LKPLLIILGPTASGKTHLAARVSSQIGGEIISADSRQLYKGMDIGTGKDLHEYTVDGHQIPYHLINIREAGEQYNVHAYQKDFWEAYSRISESARVPVVCGGTGFYIYSLLKGQAFTSVPVDGALRESLNELTKEELEKRFHASYSAFHPVADTSTHKRLIRAIEISDYLNANPAAEKEMVSLSKKYEAVIFGLNPPVDTRRKRISERLVHRLENGLVEEVRSLLDNGLSAEQLIYYGLEYKYITMYLTNQLNYKEMHQTLESEIHRFAKRQMTFFRKMEKDGLIINWLGQELTVDEQIALVCEHYRHTLNG
jgi:tRNA dimethylallyltransferase